MHRWTLFIIMYLFFKRLMKMRHYHRNKLTYDITNNESLEKLLMTISQKRCIVFDKYSSKPVHSFIRHQVTCITDSLKLVKKKPSITIIFIHCNLNTSKQWLSNYKSHPINMFASPPVKLKDQVSASGINWILLTL